MFRSTPWGRLLVLPGALAALLSAAPATARELRWSSVEVRARLDAEGVLHVVERQAMVFTGDWNGGERVFRLFPGQTLRLESLKRIAPDGTVTDLAAGDLAAVDRFAWTDRKTLRWRSRLPSDPPFDATEIVYEIAYTLSGILVREGSEDVLDHDFVFPDRDGAIERFSLELAIDPPWKAAQSFSGSLSRGRLSPGESVLVRLPLQWTGEGRPGVSRTRAGRSTRLAAFLVLLAAAAGSFLRFRAAETAVGRFDAAAPPERIDRAWLDENLFSLSPEEAGALWDGKVGPPEVSAVLARLSAEGKIETRAQGKKLSMTLRVPVDSLSGYEESLVRALFFGGRRETDTDAIRKHYESSGFDPASKIRNGLRAKLAQRREFADRTAGPAWWPAPVLFLLGLAALAWSGIGSNEEPGLLVGIGIVHLLLGGLAAGMAVLYRSRADRGEAFSLVFLWVPVLLLGLAWLAFRSTEPVSTARVAGVLLLRLAILNLTFALARTREGKTRVARRKALAAARAFFRRELSQPAPRLEDGWFPWVVAFGLTSEADRWFRVHGAPDASSGRGSGGASSSSSSRSGASGSASPSSWSGGGGSFGGAGASAGWAAAAAGIASGVSAPSSSGGGGGGGGGGSSGGGGGGGW
jgi:uncharacterized membrane protein YgcG